jgi:hypothetical protein
MYKMKNLLLAAACSLTLLSCTKQQTLPAFEPIVQANIKNENFRVSSFKAEKLAGQIKVSFTTSLEKDVLQIELMHGSNSGQLCRIKSLDVDATSNMIHTYTTIDDSPVGSPTYYTIKYTLKNGEWGCSDVYSSGL